MRDLYQEVTDKIIAQLETGASPWIRPWNATGASGLPTNFASGKQYRGINIALLWASGYTDQRWLTYKQAQDLGGQVRKGEKGTMIVFFKPWAIKDINASGESEERTIPVLKSFVVFNVTQIDGLKIEQPAIKEQPDEIRYANAAKVLSQAAVTHGGDTACYSPSQDTIRMPELAKFRSEECYWATALHELTHWTGHESRTSRIEKFARFGTAAYAREELCAEMGAAFLCAELGIQHDELRHAGYIESWLKVLRNDKKAVLQAASAAQKAADFILKRDTAKAETAEEESKAA